VELAAFVHPASGGTVLHISVQPRARSEGLVGIRGDALRLKVRAPAHEGKANRAVLDLLAGILNVPKARLSIASGQTSRRKRVFVSGVAAQAVAIRLNEGLQRLR
jgi:uncharacterized protein